MNTSNKPFLAGVQRGFTLVELMIVVAVIGILAALALPAYQDYLIRSRISEGVGLVADAKVAVSTSAQTAADLAAAAATFNNAAPASKYVRSVTVDGTTGVITVTYNEANVGNIAASSTLLVTPYLQAGGAPIALSVALSSSGGSTGILDWGCSSSTNVRSVARGLDSAVGTLESRYAPAECR
ncbi:pilin [Rhizobacter sp. Root1221]|uniref:pilin n=1 Tax=Rhizobacter sp. Root1221 TaxID=1736433 RepID=UPI0006FDF019|nr:pilin [Rhizobacter sp. Root1221]KQV96998.1 type IV pilin structural subunit [Rhizobacter sp. Root1221]